MVKQVTCAFSTIRKAADEHGIRLSGVGDSRTPDVDVSVNQINSKEVAVRGLTLAGNIFLSLLVAGAVG